MIRLTNAIGIYQTVLYLNPEKIISIEIYEDETCTRIDVGDNNYYFVTESPEEVAQKVLEYRLAMVKFTSLAQSWGMAEDTNTSGFKLNDYAMDSWEGKLMELAGLEEQKDE